MLVDIAVDVATARPPRVHGTVHVRLHQDVPDDDGTAAGADLAWASAMTDAHQTAAMLAMSHPHVVMVVGIRTVDVTDL